MSRTLALLVLFLSIAAPARADDMSTLPIIKFSEDKWHPTMSAPLVAGQAVRIEFDRDRFYDVVSWSSSWGIYFSSAHHCYGYGCCEVQFPEVGVHYRIDPGLTWTHLVLDENASAFLTLPAGTKNLEIYFDVAGYELKGWYCGCDSACVQENYAKAQFQFYEHDAWDSNYGQNYWFSVN